MVTPQDEEESKTNSKGISCPTKKEWKKAMEKEMESMTKNQVQKLVDLPIGHKAIRNKWILKIK